MNATIRNPLTDYHMIQAGRRLANLRFAIANSFAQENIDREARLLDQYCDRYQIDRDAIIAQ